MMNNIAMVDLHGLSLKEAESLVNYWLSTSTHSDLTKIRFVTGRGNHVNATGNRGVLYANFLSWIERSYYKHRIEKCEPYDGFFEIQLKPSKQQFSNADFFKRAAQQVIRNQFVEIKTRAEQGEADSQVLYAQLLESGEYGKTDFKSAAHYYKLAAEKGLPHAMHELARCFLCGIGVRQNDKQAFHWLQQADQLGYVLSTISLGDCYWHGNGVIQDERKAVSYYAKAAAQKNPLAMRKIASAYKQGIGIQKDVIKAFRWYQQSADLGDVTSQYNMATFYLNEPTLRDEKAAMYYLKLAAEGGDPDAQAYLGQCYFLGANETPLDLEKAYYWLEKAAANGSQQANHWLSFIGTKQSRETYLARSASSGNPIAEVALQMIRNGFSFDSLPSDSQFDHIFSQALHASYSLPVNDIILLDHKVKFWLIDLLLLDKKAKYYRKALSAIETMADQGCIFSVRRLAWIFGQDSPIAGIKQNTAKAISFLEKAIELGDSKSMVLLGILYEYGELGVQQSIDVAVEFYGKAEDQHNPVAYNKLAYYILNYIECSDPVMAYAIIKIASEYLQKAIEYENNPLIMKDLRSGLIDEYFSISESAAKTLKDLEFKLKKLHEFYPSLFERYTKQHRPDVASSSSDLNQQEDKSGPALLVENSQQIESGTFDTFIKLNDNSDIIIDHLFNTSHTEGNQESNMAGSSSDLNQHEDKNEPVLIVEKLQQGEPKITDNTPVGFDESLDVIADQIFNTSNSEDEENYYRTWSCSIL